ncbi:hypothetical protein AcV5_004808 [Taiwanofungus camphoratus]|nr:hypothetical protein AcV5_004808 [Antrodia cinnamomea]
MLEPSSDPILLSTSSNNLSPHVTSDAPRPSESPLSPLSTESILDPVSVPEATSKQSFYISIPALPASEKALYEDFGQRLMTSDDSEFDGLDHIIGEHNEGNTLFYYASFSSGTAHKFPAKKFNSRRPDLVEQYERSKAEGTLADFDPSAHYVHPASRVKMVLRLRRRSATERLSSNSDELAMGLDSDDSDESSPLVRRKSARVARMGVKKIARDLPFSPKKTRAATRPVIVHGSDSEDVLDSDIEEVLVSTRRSTRTQKRARSDFDDGDFEDELDEISDEYAVEKPTKPKVTKKKVIRGKASRPAYGRFRVIADLELDKQEDEETAPLRAHRDVCEKCHREPAHDLLAAAAKKSKKGKRKNSKNSEDEDIDGNEEERLAALGGWVRCLKCPVSAHWSCLAKTQRDEILKAAFECDKAEWRNAQVQATAMDGEDAAVKKSLLEPVKRARLGVYQTTEFVCGSCMKGGICMMCKEVAIVPDNLSEAEPVDKAPASDEGVPKQGMENADGMDLSTSVSLDNIGEKEPTSELLFRCITCKRLAHYSHLPFPQELTVYPAGARAIELADYYQTLKRWQCPDCASFVYSVEHILAWRPYPENAVEVPHPVDEPVNYKTSLPREYLVKWADRSYRRTSWVPHMWLVATNATRLKNFLSNGSKIQLLAEAISEEKADGNENIEVATFEFDQEDSNDSSGHPGGFSPLLPLSDAELRIPSRWKTVDRVLDVLLWLPEKRLRSHKNSQHTRRNQKRAKRIESDDGDKEYSERAVADAEYEAAFKHGEELSEDLTESVDEYERRTGKTLDERQIDRVVWAFFKWNDLGYEDASWDSPPREGESGYSAFKSGFQRFIAARKVSILYRSKKDGKQFDERAKNAFRQSHAFTNENQPNLGQGSQLKLMPFQIDGINWLVDNWWNHQHCILADEMGLGKTVQIVTFIGHVSSTYKANPTLVVVPNSTISNWVREFERWAPKLRVVPFYGENKAREVIKRYELYHQHPQKGTTGAKYHVLVTTYEMITNAKEFMPVFRSTPRWEILVVDEGQRLKNDSSLIFRKLKELTTIHRVIMTGTPLNNNIRELFNLMNFLDPGEWRDLDALAKEYEVLSEEGIKQLHTKLKPYFLRRIKAEVLQLPPKNEVIVPVSMAPLQKEVYTSILSANLDILRTLVSGPAGEKVHSAISKTNMNNILMQLRKCLQHPYLVSDEIEPRGLSPEESHAKLIDASAKFGLLKMLLPKLQARGHRVLLFSQFAIALDIIEDFCIGERVKYLRLDGDTKQADRQKGMDEFNKPGSDVFIYLLTTRAGGVGINLWSADTVIIFDPDFNPHQDLQAIARAHRYGQTKPCLVFKLMVKGSAEDKIMQTGKKKLVLDHLIVQKMDDEDGPKEDVQSTLLFGAKALFEEGASDEHCQIHYSEHDIDNLIEKTEKEGDEVELQAGAGAAFSFAKIWSADKDTFEDIADNLSDNVDAVDSWAQTLERIAAERSKVEEKEVTGRGARRRAAAVFPQQPKLDLDDPLYEENKKPKRRGKKAKLSDDSDFYTAPAVGSESDTESIGPVSSLVADDLPRQDVVRSSSPPLPPSRTDAMDTSRSEGINTGSQPLPLPLNRPQHPQAGGGLQSPQDSTSDSRCGLCGGQHGGNPCHMTNSSQNLAQYRYMLLVHAGDEPLDERRAAIQAIDETLHERGELHLIYGQPLHLVEKASSDRNGSSHNKHRKDRSMVSVKPRKAFLPVRREAQVNTHGGSSLLVRGQQRPEQVGLNPRPVPPRPQPLPRVSNAIVNAAAGPSKRSPSPRPLESPRKKKFREGPSLCAVCGRSPHHLVKDCPVVAQGPKRVQDEIKRLEDDPRQASTVHVLRKILAKQQRRSMSTTDGPVRS